MNWRLRLATWLLKELKAVPISNADFDEYCSLKAQVSYGQLTALSAIERQWLRQLNSGQYKLLATSIVESLSQPPPPLVPKDLTDAARDYVLFLSKCEISDEEKFRQAVAKMQRRFPQWKKRKLSLAIQLVINEK